MKSNALDTSVTASLLVCNVYHEQCHYFFLDNFTRTSMEIQFYSSKGKKTLPHIAVRPEGSSIHFTLYKYKKNNTS